VDDELKRKIAATLDGEPDATTAALLKSAPEAREYARQLRLMDRSLSQMPAPRRDADAWERFAKTIESKISSTKLDEKREQSDQTNEFDPLASPFPDEGEGTGNGLQANRSNNHKQTSKQIGRQTERKDMGTSQEDKDNEEDLENLAALVRTSVPPAAPTTPKAVSPGPSLVADGLHDSSGVVDIKQLADLALKQSVPPPATALAPAPADKTGKVDTAIVLGGSSQESKEDAKKKAPSAVPPSTAAEATPAKVAPPPKRSPFVWIVPTGIAAALGVFILNSQGNSPSSSGSVSVERESPREERVENRRRENSPTQPPENRQENVPTQTALANTGANVASEARDLRATDAAAAPSETAHSEESPTNTAESASLNANSMAVGSTPSNPQPSAQNVVAVAPRPASQNPSGNGGEQVRIQTATATERPRANPAMANAESDSVPTTLTPQARLNLAAAVRSTPPSTTPTPPTTTPPTATTTTAPSGASAPATRSGTPSPNTQPTAAQPRTIQQLLAAAVPETPQQVQQHQTEAEQANLPDLPSRVQVTSILTGLNPRIRSCANGQTGTATFAITIKGDGTVQNASLQAGGYPNEARACMENVIRGARFPQFRRPSTTLAFPFSILPPRIDQSQK